MIFVVQVYPYETNNGCSVRIGKAYDNMEILYKERCIIFEFVETKKEVKEMIKLIRKLPQYYRHKEESIQKLEQYMNRYC